MSGSTELSRLIVDGTTSNKRDIESQRAQINGDSLTGTSSDDSNIVAPQWLTDILKSFAYGGSDGIMTSLVIMSAAAGANLSWRIAVTITLAAAFSNAVSTGINEYLSSKAHREFIEAEKMRELWQFKHFKEAQIAAMVSRFESRGMSRRDAEVVVGKMAQCEGFFVNLMVADDLGLQLSDDSDANFLTDSFIMMVSHAILSSIPVLILGVGSSLGLAGSQALFMASAGSSLLILFVLAVVKSRISSSSWIMAGVEALGLGALCSMLAYFLGHRLILFCMS
mmetsp:Transcript_38970/g.77599  ORF Transcript_38970/g.77599 Transcript_38970/m.77599 type:complete len:281 (+) Transcript_38970:34-876(+)